MLPLHKTVKGRLSFVGVLSCSQGTPVPQNAIRKNFRHPDRAPEVDNRFFTDHFREGAGLPIFNIYGMLQIQTLDKALQKAAIAGNILFLRFQRYRRRLGKNPLIEEVLQGLLRIA